MEEYLKRFCNFLINKDNANIDDTIGYIKNYQSDNKEILNSYTEIIDTEKICRLVKNIKFLPDYDHRSKIELFQDFFTYLYNYAKNLIKNFDIYSSKTILESSVIMKGNIKLFPHYKRYMEKLLCYEYNELKSEWVMKRPNSWNLRYKLAALCIITATGYQNIKEMDEYWTSSDSGSGSGSDSDMTAVRESAKWRCMGCGYDNDISVVNCKVCFECQVAVNRRNGTETATRPSIVDKRQRNSIKAWTCENCTVVNDMETNQCEACGQTSPNVMVASVNNSRDTSRSFSSIFPGKDRDGGSSWQCTYCTAVNNITALTCDVCYNVRTHLKDVTNRYESTARKNSIHSVMRSNTERVKEKSMKLSPGKGMKICEKCESPNYVTETKCKYCGTNFKLRTSQSSSDMRTPKENVWVTSVNSSGDTSKPFSSISPGKDRDGGSSWQCTHCTTVNNINALTCEVCYAGRTKVAADYKRRNVYDSTAGNYSAGLEMRSNTERVKEKSMKLSLGKEMKICEKCKLQNDVTATKCKSCLANFKLRTSQSVSDMREPIENKHQCQCDKCSSINDTKNRSSDGCSKNKLQSTKSMPVKDNESREDNMWVCARCSFSNHANSVNCRSCKDSRNKQADSSASRIAVGDTENKLRRISTTPLQGRTNKAVTPKPNKMPKSDSAKSPKHTKSPDTKASKEGITHSKGPSKGWKSFTSLFSCVKKNKTSD